MAKKCLRSNICRNKRGFTLIEVLIVVAIICVLGVASVGYYGNYIEDAKIAVRRTNMKIVNDSIGNYYKNNNMTYPKYTELDLALSSYMNLPASEILKEACNAEGMDIYYRTVLPLKKTSDASANVNANIAANASDTSRWKSASEIADDSEHAGQHRVKEVMISPTHPVP